MQCLLCLDHAHESLCPPCKAELPWAPSPSPPGGPWDRGVSPLLYQPPVVNLISQLKFSRQFHAARTLVNLFLERLPPGPRPELLLPVPLHGWRQLWRGFNQSTELARLLSQGLGIPYSPYYLKRIKHSRAQRTLNRKVRMSNVSRVFALTRPLPVSHIALIDDVLTTGETLGALCRTIQAAHPTICVEVWSMAQTPLER